MDNILTRQTTYAVRKGLFRQSTNTQCGQLGSALCLKSNLPGFRQSPARNQKMNFFFNMRTGQKLSVILINYWTISLLKLKIAGFPDASTFSRGISASVSLAFPVIPEASYLANMVSPTFEKFLMQSATFCFTTFPTILSLFVLPLLIMIFWSARSSSIALSNEGYQTL